MILGMKSMTGHPISVHPNVILAWLVISDTKAKCPRYHWHAQYYNKTFNKSTVAVWQMTNRWLFHPLRDLFLAARLRAQLLKTVDFDGSLLWDSINTPVSEWVSGGYWKWEDSAMRSSTLWLIAIQVSLLVLLAALVDQLAVQAEKMVLSHSRFTGFQNDSMFHPCWLLIFFSPVHRTVS